MWVNRLFILEKPRKAHATEAGATLEIVPEEPMEKNPRGMAWFSRGEMTTAYSGDRNATVYGGSPLGLREVKAMSALAIRLNSLPLNVYGTMTTPQCARPASRYILESSIKSFNTNALTYLTPHPPLPLKGGGLGRG